MNDSPQPHASLILGFLNENLALVKDRQSILSKDRADPGEHGPEGIFLPIHLTPDDRKESFRVDEHSDSVLLHDFIKLAGLVYVV